MAIFWGEPRLQPRLVSILAEASARESLGIAHLRGGNSTTIVLSTFPKSPIPFISPVDSTMLFWMLAFCIQLTSLGVCSSELAFAYGRATRLGCRQDRFPILSDNAGSPP